LRRSTAIRSSGFFSAKVPRISGSRPSAAARWLKPPSSNKTASFGFSVSKPWGESDRYDFILDFRGLRALVGGFSCQENPHFSQRRREMEHRAPFRLNPQLRPAPAEAGIPEIRLYAAINGRSST